ncbi:putative SRP19 protein [Ordospora pajunii]|uniref:putative SRP19 protein n=1 Tax=Ordospora pajunii TaxID=3039483 RepID=UPI00295268FB|nr:putative SRP19 protein [Ordospora pajunii]KAH9411018.1 putative SRP19 protein [Ordospora pajunii]
MDNSHFCLYPVYIDSMKSASEGRKYGIGVCVPAPKWHEIKSALCKLDIEHVSEPGSKHPRDFLNPGRFRIDKKYGKKFVVEGLSTTILEERNSTQKQPGARQGHSKASKGIVQNGIYVENKLNLVRKKKEKKKRQ